MTANSFEDWFGKARHRAAVHRGMLLLAACVCPVPSSAAIVPKDSDERIEIPHWSSVKDSKHAPGYETYFEANPQGRFTLPARAGSKYLRENESTAQAATTLAPDPEPGRTAGEPPPVAVADTTPAIEPLQAELVVQRNANVRVAPATTAKRITYLKAGNRVRVTGRVRDQNWYRIALDNGSVGFVNTSLLREPASSSLPAAGPAPPAPPPAASSAPPAPPPVASSAPPAPPPVASSAPPAPPPVASSAPPAPPPVASSAAVPNPEAEDPAPPSPAPPPASNNDVFRDCDDCPELVRVPAGTFIMGSRDGDSSERPAHRVTVAQPFAIGRFEVSVGEWAACVKAGACAFDGYKAGDNPRLPIRNLSWLDTGQFLGWLSKRTGKVYRLPTESEWEYTARAGTTTSYWWGANFQRGKANCKGCDESYDRKSPVEIDTFPANAFGLYGTAGGVWEWTEDCWHNSHEGAPTDTEARQRSGCRLRVLRGGSWRNDASYARSSSRLSYDADVRYSVNGFRVARTLP